MTNHAENFPHSHAHLPASSASPTPPQQISADQLTAQVQAQPQSQPQAQAQAQAASTMDLRVRLLNGAVQPVRVPRGITIHKLRAELQTRGLIPPNLPARDVRLIHVPFSAAPPAAGRSGESAGPSAQERRTSVKEVAEASGYLGGVGGSRPKVLSSKLLTVGECGVDSGDTLVITRIRAPTPCQLAAPDSSAETAAAAAEAIPTRESIDRAIEAECARRGVPLPPPPAATSGLGLHTTTAAAAAAAIAAAQRVRVVADPVLVDRLAEMGFPRLMARHALQLHRSNRVAAAIEWLIENPDAEEQALQAESAAADAPAAPAGPGGRGGEGGGGGAAGEAGAAGAAGAGGAGEGAGGGGDEGGSGAAAGGLASGDSTGVSLSAGGAGVDAGATGAADSGAAGGGGEGAGVAAGNSEGLPAVAAGEAAEMDPPSSSAVAASGGMMCSGVSGEAGAAAPAGAAGAGAVAGAAAGSGVPMGVAAAAAAAAAVQEGVRAGTGEAPAATLGDSQPPLQGDLPAELREAWAQIAGMHVVSSIIHTYAPVIPLAVINRPGFLRKRPQHMPIRPSSHFTLDERSVRAWNRMMALQTIMGASGSTSPSHLSSSSASLPPHEARDPFVVEVEGGEGGEEEAMDVEGAALWAMANEMLRHGLTNPRVRQAISDMQDNPHAIYTFLNDAE
ncbi:unnamed protein product, partial [Closterium sp. Naga37s-1]